MASTQSHPQRKLLRVLGLAFGLAAVVGGMVGQGILRTPGIVAGAAHSPELILLLWLAGALIVAISAVAYIELGTAIPCAGDRTTSCGAASETLPGWRSAGDAG